jgi:hypothetical protein
VTRFSGFRQVKIKKKLGKFERLKYGKIKRKIVALHGICFTGAVPPRIVGSGLTNRLMKSQ